MPGYAVTFEIYRWQVRSRRELPVSGRPAPLPAIEGCEPSRLLDAVFAEDEQRRFSARPSARAAAGMGDIRSVVSGGTAGRMCAAPKPYPEEFRDDVVRVARSSTTAAA
ncbi:hypothetical protein GCM10027174_07420 [Salinifilum aidingensis]